MDTKANHFKKWFGYNRRERRATSILLLIAVIVFTSRYIVPGKPAEIKNLTGDISDLNPGSLLSDNIQADSVKLFPFDPNKATSSELMKLGLTEKQTGTIINYRNAGGKFYQPSDFAKIYGIDQKKITELLPYAIIGYTDRSVESQNKVKVQERINLNTCDSVMLDKLPGIGPVLSARIIKYRNLLGGYSQIGQLKEVYGLSIETFALISEKVFADSVEVNIINVNDAAYKDLIRHPYFETIEVTSILKYRELIGRISGINELVENKILTIEKAKKLYPYLSFR
jgi:competence protein ComEA